MEKSGPLITWQDIWRKVIPWLIIASLGALGKGIYDVYAFTSTKEAVISSISENTENIKKLKKSNVEVDKKIDKVLTALCMINKRTCELSKNE